MAKLTLKVSYDYDFTLLAIVASCRIYKLCWHLNKLLKLQLSKQNDIEVADKEKRQMDYFDNYLYLDENQQISYQIIANKCRDGLFIPELKKIDYLFLIKGDTYKSPIIESLKELPIIELISETLPGQLKSAYKLLVIEQIKTAP